MAKEKPKRRFGPEILSDEEVRALMEDCGTYAPRASPSGQGERRCLIANLRIIVNTTAQ